MQFTFLGTGTSQGIPVIACPCNVCHSKDPRDKRLRTSLLIEHNQTTMVIDSGPDFRQQLLREDITVLDAILFTHEHKDHIAGLDDVRAFNFIQKKPMDIWAEPRVQYAIRREFAYVFAEYKYPGIPQINLHRIEPGRTFHVNSLDIIPLRVYHYRLPIIGYRIGQVTYITDANYIPENVFPLITGTKVLVMNALRKKKHLTHFNLGEALEVIDRVKPEQAFLTHISHQMGLHSEVEEELPDNVHLAYDGLKVAVS